MEKLAFALVIVACKLKPYFQAHTVIILTNKPLRRAMNNLEAVERMTLWEIELSEFNIQYRLLIAIKGQVVADFFAKFTNVEGQGVEKYPQQSIHTDGSSNRQVGGAGIAIRSLEGDEIKCVVHLNFPMINNEAEYEALVAGLDLAKAVRAIRVVVH